jgi:hypothetical protein
VQNKLAQIERIEDRLNSPRQRFTDLPAREDASLKQTDPVTQQREPQRRYGSRRTPAHDANVELLRRWRTHTQVFAEGSNQSGLAREIRE